MVGRTIEVLWFDEETGESWEKAVINEFNDLDKTHLVVYEDGDQDWYDLADLKYRIPANAETTEKGFLAERHLVKTFSAIGMAGTALVGQRVEVFWTHDKDPDQQRRARHKHKYIVWNLIFIHFFTHFHSYFLIKKY